MKAAKRKILPLLWLLIALFELLFAAQLASAKSAFVPENRVWKIFPLAAESHQPNIAQVAEPQRERAPPQRSTVPGCVLAPENEITGTNLNLASGANGTLYAEDLPHLSDVQQVAAQLRQDWSITTRNLQNSGAPLNMANASTQGGGVPPWLQRIQQGNAFDAEQSANYPYNQVYIENGSGGYTPPGFV